MTPSDFSQESLRELTSKWSSQEPGQRFKVYKDTTDFFRIEYGDIVILDGSPFLIRHNAKEGRFGLDDEEKFWVKRSIDLRSGMTKIIKFVFFEKFNARIGDIEFECFRSPRKEARILNLVRNLPNFMQGYSVQDDHENIVRILEFIYGIPLAEHIREIATTMDHETYFYQYFPKILDNYILCVEGIRFLHDHGEKHGDIRRDHILIDRESGQYRWIDYDYNFRHSENIYGYDLFGLGNILMYLVGMGDTVYQELKRSNHPSLDHLIEDDFNIVFHNRIANLKKIYFYIPDSLNRILMHFSKGAHVFYDYTTQLIDDLREVQSTFPK
jgi:serine/threonine protein kinase